MELERLSAVRATAQGLWELNFNKDNTSPASFTLEGGSKVEVRTEQTFDASCTGEERPANLQLPLAPHTCYRCCDSGICIHMHACMSQPISAKSSSCSKPCRSR